MVCTLLFGSNVASPHADARAQAAAAAAAAVAQRFQTLLVWAACCQVADTSLQLALTPRRFPRLAPFSRRDLARLRNTLIAFVHSVLMFGGALPYMLPLFRPSFPFVEIPKVSPNSAVEVFYIELMLGYLVYDLVACWRQGDGFLILAHHLLGMASHFPMRLFDVGGSYLMWVHFAEGSTPFLHAGWLCRKFHVEGPLPTALNLAFASMFFVTRVLSAPLCLYSLARSRPTWPADKLPLHTLGTTITVFFVALNYLWWLKIVQQIRAALSGKKLRAD